MLQSKDCFSFSASRGSARHFFILLFLVTKRAARFRRVALKKLLSVFAEQPLCLPWHIYIIPHSFAKINTILSKFVQIRPHLSKFVQPALESRKNKKFSRLVQFRFCRAVLEVKGGLIIHAPFAKAAYAAKC